MADKWGEYIDNSNDSSNKWDSYVEPTNNKNVNTIKTQDEIIGNRPSILKDAVNNPIDFKQHPFKRSLQDIGATFEVLEGVPSSIGLDLQEGKPQNIIPNIKKVFSGERPAQRGDILRTLGVPEPIAATIGFMSGLGTGVASSKSVISKMASMTKYLPDNVLANIGGKGASVAYKATGLKSLVDNYGKPAIARTLSILSQVPVEQVNDAIDNPQFLSRKFLNSEKEAVQSQYKKVINPLIDDSSKKVNFKNFDVSNLNFVSASGEPTKAWQSMRPSERNKMANWLSKLSSGEMSFNNADALKGQMDEALSSTYRREAKGIAVDYSNDFIRSTKQLRDSINNTIKVQYPEVGKVLDRYSKYKSGELLYKAFDVYHPHLWQTLIGGGIGMGNRGVGAAMIAGSIPKVQGLGIRGGGLVSEALGQSGAGIPEAMFEQYRQNALLQNGNQQVPIGVAQ